MRSGVETGSLGPGERRRVQPFPLPAPGDPQPGDVIGGRYRVDHLVGREAACDVVLAADASGRPVAIAMLRRDVASPQAVARFVEEGQRASQIEDEHVVRVFEVGEVVAGLPFVAMEYVEGR